MIQFEVHRKFKKQFKLFSPKVRKKVSERLKIFVKNPQDKTLRVHSLTGDLLGLYAFSITGDIRLIFSWQNTDKTKALFLKIGKHSQVY